MNNNHFKDIGVMLDLSRGKVLKVATIKKYIYAAKSFGYTYVNLYVEDLITLENYPQYGRLRGKYSDNELIEIVEYCEELNIEIFPAIQTLGHMENFLRWEESEKLRDTEQVINVLNEESLHFINDLISKCRLIFKSDKINIGMDEAFDLGMGQLSKNNNQLSQKELYMNHLNAVVDICLKNNFKCIKIWSDMLFNVYSNAGAEGLYKFDETTNVEEINDKVELIFWNYWTRETSQYEQTIDAHRKFSNNVSMAMGIHTSAFPFYESTLSYATKSALKACKSKGIEDILFTMWGDDGSIYNLDSAIYGMYITSCFVNEEEGNPEFFEQITGTNFKALKRASEILKCSINPLLVLWNDPITNIQLKSLTDSQLSTILENAKSMISNDTDQVTEIYNLYLKCMINDIELYNACDIEASKIAIAKDDLFRLYHHIEQLWLNEAKVHGLEEVQLRFVSKIARYQFLLDHKDNEEIAEIRRDRSDKIEKVKDFYSTISKATKFRW